MMPGAKWAVDSIADCARRFMAHPQVKGRRVYGQVGFNFAAHARGLPLTPGWPLLTLTVPREELILKRKCHRLCGLRRRVPTFVRGKEAGTTTQNAPLAVDTALNGEAYKQQVARAVAEIRRGEYVKVIVSRAIPAIAVDMPATLLYGRQAKRLCARLCSVRKDATLGFSRNW